VTSGVTGRAAAIQGVPTRAKALESLLPTRRVGRKETPKLQRKAADELQILGTGRSLLTVREAAEVLRVRPCTVYRLVREGQLRAIRVSHAIRIRERDVQALQEGA